MFTETFVIGEIMNNNKKIVLFGGSFNPPTIAHYEIIKYLNDHYDEVLILPNGESYSFAGKVLDSFKHRVNMFNDRTTIIIMMSNCFIFFIKFAPNYFYFDFYINRFIYWLCGDFFYCKFD